VLDEYSLLRHICNGVLLGHDPKRTRVLVISHAKSVYLDDAGHPVDKPYLVLGGFISTESRWIDFERPWKEILASRKIPFPFHATDFFHEHIKDPKIKHIVEDLVRTISNHVEAAFSAALDMEAYKAANRVRRLEEFSGSPISMLSRSLRENIDNWRNRNQDESPLLYFIENGTYQRGDLEDCWKYIDKRNPPIPVAKEHPSAQAADLYAYSVYRSGPFIVPSWQHQMFHDIFQIKGIYHADAKTMEAELKDYLSKPTAHVNELGGKVVIPNRESTKNIDVRFDGNPNKKQSVRRAKIGIPNDRPAKIRSSDGDDSPRGPKSS
jgi:hypothetical protein